MARIRVLPDDLANQIAAGEVVERPASIVKELIENALDAGARRVAVKVDEGGRRRISVEDDGCGMAPDDARLSIQRHATSKIVGVDDLFRITTLGFRGEALPSIASVSRLTLLTAPREPATSSGTRLMVDGGRLVSDEPASCNPGTSVTVADLFHNVPARRKFLKRPETEQAHIARVVVSYALAHADVSFVLESGGRTSLDLPPREGVMERARDCLAEEMTTDATLVTRDLGDLRLTAVLASLRCARGNRDWQYVFVNQRLVRDRLIGHALFRSYEQLVPKGRHAGIVLLLEIDPRNVDVNVHPTKAEVRLQDGHRVFELVSGTLKRAYLERGDVAPLPVAPTVLAHEQIQGTLRTHLAMADGGASLGLERPLVELERRERPAARSRCASALDGGTIEEYLPGHQEVPRVIGQFRRTFILAADAHGLLLIDQHVAHERILYERAFADLARAEARQQLLVPELIEIDALLAATLRERRAELEGLGFAVEDFGTGTIALRTVPAAIAGGAAGPLLREMLDDMTTGDHPAGMSWRHELAARVACRDAVKARRQMERGEQEGLVTELWACENRYHCPHGRPILMRLGYDQIARHFERR